MYFQYVRFTVFLFFFWLEYGFKNSREYGNGFIVVGSSDVCVIVCVCVCVCVCAGFKYRCDVR